MTNGLRIAVVDDHPLFREGVVRSMAANGGFNVVGEGSSCNDAIRLAQEEQPDILLLDLSMPGGGLQAIEAIHRSNPDVRLVALTVSEDADDVAEALESGVSGYVLKGVGSRTLAEILHMVAQGETYVSPALSAQMLSSLSRRRSEMSAAHLLDELTERERQILEHVAEGLSNKHIALNLTLSEKTVKHHMTAILAKLKARNRTEAAIKFRAMMS